MLLKLFKHPVLILSFLSFLIIVFLSIFVLTTKPNDLKADTINFSPLPKGWQVLDKKERFSIIKMGENECLRIDIENGCNPGSSISLMKVECLK